jgi:hypothetical protein
LNILRRRTILGVSQPVPHLSFHISTNIDTHTGEKW